MTTQVNKFITSDSIDIAVKLIAKNIGWVQMVDIASDRTIVANTYWERIMNSICRVGMIVL